MTTDRPHGHDHHQPLNGLFCEPTASQERPSIDPLDLPCRHEYPHDGPCKPVERPPIDVEQIVRAALRVVDQDTPLSVGEPLIQKAIRYATNLARLSGPVGECSRFRHDEHCAHD